MRLDQADFLVPTSNWFTLSYIVVYINNLVYLFLYILGLTTL